MQQKYDMPAFRLLWPPRRCSRLLGSRHGVHTRGSLIVTAAWAQQPIYEIGVPSGHQSVGRYWITRKTYEPHDSCTVTVLYSISLRNARYKLRKRCEACDSLHFAYKVLLVSHRIASYRIASRGSLRHWFRAALVRERWPWNKTSFDKRKVRHIRYYGLFTRRLLRFLFVPVVFQYLSCVQIASKQV